MTGVATGASGDHGMPAKRHDRFAPDGRVSVSYAGEKGARVTARCATAAASTLVMTVLGKRIVLYTCRSLTVLQGGGKLVGLVALLVILAANERSGNPVEMSEAGGVISAHRMKLKLTACQ